MVSSLSVKFSSLRHNETQEMQRNS